MGHDLIKFSKARTLCKRKQTLLDLLVYFGYDWRASVKSCVPVTPYTKEYLLRAVTSVKVKLVFSRIIPEGRPVEEQLDSLKKAELQ